MGQRLNMEICSNGQVLANAYYHWSAYTSSSLELLKVVLNAYKHTKELSSLKIAVDILQATGAGINESELERIKRDESGKFNGIDFREAINRNEGLLCVTEEGIANTKSWEEGRVTVDIDKEEFIFDVMCVESNSEYDECGRDIMAADLPDTMFDFTAPCPFHDFDKFEKEISDNPNGVRIDEDSILCWIE